MEMVFVRLLCKNVITGKEFVRSSTEYLSTQTIY